MKKRTKKLLSLLLAIAMMLSLAPLSVFAADDPAPAEPVVAEELAEEPADPETGSVVAVVYGDAMEEALLAVEQDYNLLEDEMVSFLTWRGRTIPKLQNISGDATPMATFSIVDAAGNETELIQDTTPKGSEYVEINGEKPELLTEALDAIQANNFSVYRVDGLTPGTYTLKLKYLAEPYGLRNNDLLTQTITVEAGKTTIAGGDTIEVRGHANETEKVWVGTEEKSVVDSWIPYRTHKETVDKYETRTNTYEYTLNFLGYFLRKETRAFSFKTTDVAGEPIAGSEFVLVNRDDLDDILKAMIGVGKDVFVNAVKNFQDPEIFSFEELVAAHKDLIGQNVQGYVTIEPEAAYNIVKTYFALLSGSDKIILNELINYDENGQFAGLKHHIPAILKATSDKDGIVYFSEKQNVTLTFLLDVVTDLGVGILEGLGDSNPFVQMALPLLKAVQVLNNIENIDFANIGAQELIALVDIIPEFNDTFKGFKQTILNYATEHSDNLDNMMDNWIVKAAVQGLGTLLVNSKGWILDFIYGQLQSFGIVGEKFENGHYLMFQYSVPKESTTETDEEGNVNIVEKDIYMRSPLVYTLDVEWTEPDNFYVTVADLGIVGPYFAEGFYDFVRGTNYEGPVAKALGMAANGYGTAYTFSNGNLYLTQKLHDIMTGKIEDAKVKGALTAYLADATYRVLGLNLLYSTKVGLMQGYNDYLKQNQQMNLDLQAYVNKLAKKAKAVYTADLTPVENEDGSVDYWTFYTLDSSPTLTATKLINQSTKNIAAAMPEGSEKQAGVLQNGATISNIVNKVGTRIEEANKKVAQNIQSALTKAFGDIGAKLKEGVTKLVGSLFSNLFGGGANQTAGA